MQFFHNTNIDFLSKRRFFFFASVIINVVGILVVAIKGLEYGIDFVGGTEIGVRFSGSSPVQTEQVRRAMEDAQFTGSEIKSYGKTDEFLIRLPNVAGKDYSSTAIMESLKKTFPNQTITLLKVDKIGPKVGAELRNKALLALGLSFVMIMVYIAFRFEFLYGLGAIVALLHDAILAFVVSVMVHDLGIINLEVNQSMLAAMLTVIGFSVHDTVIIFDRIRENREKHKNMPFLDMVNLSINETLSRTINTVLTAVLVLIVITVFGGEVLQGFAFVMLVGFITGAYSSIYIASAFVAWYLETFKKYNLHVETYASITAKAKA
ncbi:MAG: protein translocase subunit SecF [Bacteroidota bacterium]|nr:protein translocase subunit SecF [Candidatus Kapabacteria bacterium]MDW8220087.1 protein translocase subunit SecF [Bacteroidota bacterium]